MALPDKQVLLDQVLGLSRVADSDLEAILMTALEQFLQGAPLDPDAPVQELITASNQAQCLARQEVLALIVRKIMQLLEIVAELSAQPQIIFGSGVINPNGVVMATGYAIYRDTAYNSLWSHDTNVASNTDWTPLLQ